MKQEFLIFEWCGRVLWLKETLFHTFSTAWPANPEVNDLFFYHLSDNNYLPIRFANFLRHKYWRIFFPIWSIFWGYVYFQDQGTSSTSWRYIIDICIPQVPQDQVKSLNFKLRSCRILNSISKQFQTHHIYRWASFFKKLISAFKKINYLLPHVKIYIQKNFFWKAWIMKQ